MEALARFHYIIEREDFRTLLFLLNLTCKISKTDEHDLSISQLELVMVNN